MLRIYTVPAQKLPTRISLSEEPISILPNITYTTFKMTIFFLTAALRKNSNLIKAYILVIL